MWQSRSRWWSVVGLTVGLTVLTVPNHALAEEEIDRGVVERLVADFADKTGYPGITVAITEGDRVLHVAGYGYDSSGAAVTATTPMPVASVSKSFTALAVMQLVEAGAVALDGPVRDYLPDFRLSDPRAERITVRQLLNHTSGITDRTLREKSLPQPGSLQAAVVRARSATLATEPGTAYAYTNTNYHLAARLVEVVADEPFADYLRRHVFEPLGMGTTTAITLTPHDLPPDVRKGHVYAYGASIAATEPKRFVAGSDGVITTARDMAQWLVLQNNAGRAADGTRLISAESVTAMHTSSDERWRYAMGWSTDSDGWVDHNGIWFTYSASQLLLPSGHGIAVIGNSGLGLANESTGPLADALAALVTGDEIPSPAPIRLVTDLVLAGLAALSIALGLRNLLRTSRWATRVTGRPAWRLGLRLVPRLVPLALLVSLPDLLGLLVGGGRDITFSQLCYASPALVAWATVAASLNVSVLAVRVVALVRLHRPAGAPPPRQVPSQPMAG